MKIGYARVSTKDQNVDLQLDALKQAGCERIYQEVASGAKTARPELDRLLVDIHAGDTIVIWKLDRLGRSLKHLVELMGKLVERKIGLLSLNDPVDTTNAQGRLVFNLSASLAEFERELIQERTHAGLSAARARGRIGGRPKVYLHRRKAPQWRLKRYIAKGDSVSAPLVKSYIYPKAH
jgi:DNA invertase Pin-like site-specific DNA recombinase